MKMKEKNYAINNAENRPAIKTVLCKRCQKPFEMHKRWGWKATKAVVETIETSWFRGDDIVNFYHINCWKNKEIAI